MMAFQEKQQELILGTGAGNVIRTTEVEGAGAFGNDSPVKMEGAANDRSQYLVTVIGNVNSPAEVTGAGNGVWTERLAEACYSGRPAEVAGASNGVRSEKVAQAGNCGRPDKMVLVEGQGSQQELVMVAVQ